MGATAKADNGTRRTTAERLSKGGQTSRRRIESGFVDRDDRRGGGGWLTRERTSSLARGGARAHPAAASVEAWDM